MLRPLVRGERVDAGLLFLFGLAAIEAAQQPGVSEDARGSLLDEAIAAFHTMLVKAPRLIRVRLELARAFFLKDEDRLARQHFEQVLAGNPPSGVALNVNRFLAEIRARKRWSLRVGAAVAPDSNIGAGSDERIIYIDVNGQRLPFRRDQEELTSSGIGISAWAGGEYQYPLGDRYRLRAGGDITRREYRKSEFDRMSLAGHLGPRWLVGKYTEASLLASARHEWTGSGLEEPSHHDIGLRVEGRHRLGQRTTLNARASRHERRYDERRHLDGPITDLSFGVSWVASPTARIDASVGWGRLRPEMERERNTSRRVQVGVIAALPWGFTVGGSGSLRWTDYEGDWFPFTPAGQSRSDLVRSLRVFAHNRAVTAGRVQPADLPGAGTAEIERPAPRLRAHLRRAAIRPPVLRGTVQRPPDLNERLAGIEEKMATRATTLRPSSQATADRCAGPGVLPRRAIGFPAPGSWRRGDGHRRAGDRDGLRGPVRDRAMMSGPRPGP